MTSDKSRSVALAKEASLVVRSSVPSGLEYSDYRRYLRADFLYSCAYCTMSESEAHGIRFCIDHYEPKRARPDLVDDYSNLMYACDQCNVLKGDRCPPPSAREEGYRFFRPDNDLYEDNFELSDLRLRSKTPVGYYTIEALDLNRAALRTIRHLRARLSECESHIAAGVLALRRFQLDQLPPRIRGQALKMIRDFEKVADALRNEIDSILSEFARSSLLDEDAETKGRAIERSTKLAGLAALHPGSWRAPKKSG